MKKFIALLILAIGLFASTVSGQNDCPTLVGPARILAPDEPLRYKVIIEPNNSDRLLKYIWSVASGRIVSGQGTSSVEVLRGEIWRTTVVTVKILGLPEKNCPYIFSESSTWDPAPSAVKIGVWKSGQAPAPLQQFAEALTNNLDNQGYVFIIRGPSSTQKTLLDLRNTIISSGPLQQVVDHALRVTIVEAEGPEELAEVWRVPPGAENPKCESCKTTECPTVTVRGPAGIWMPGEQITFTGIISPTQYKSLSYRWTIEGGSIAEGQGTSAVNVSTPKGDHVQITAKLDIEGLSSGCPASFSETTGATVNYQALLLDEHSTPIRQINRASLDKLAKRLTERPTDTGLIIEYFPPNTAKSSIDLKIKLIRDYMLSRGRSEHEYKIVVSEAQKPLTRIYLVPPGSQFPAP